MNQVQKKFNRLPAIFLFVCLGLLSSCLKNFVSINKNEKKSSSHYYFSRSLTSASEKMGLVKLNNQGEAFVYGYYKDTLDFSYGVGSADVRTSAGNSDAFITKFDTSGNPVWTRTFGNLGQDVIAGISFNSDGSILASGRFTGNVDFDLSGTAPDIQVGVGNTDAFVMKISAAGQKVWVKTFGGAGAQQVASNVVKAADENIYVSGSFCGTSDFDPGVGVANLAAATCDGYLATLDNDGNYISAISFGGTVWDWGYGLFVDRNNNIFIPFGTIGSTVTYQGFSVPNMGGGDLGVLSLDSSGNLRWGNMVGTSGWDGGASLALDAEGNTYFTTNFTTNSSIDFNLTGSGSSDVRTSRGLYDIAITKISNDGTYQWTKVIGSTGNDNAGMGKDLGDGPITANAIQVTDDGRMLIVGTFSDTVDFSLNDTGEHNKTALNSTDGFVLELDAVSGEFVKVQTYNLPVGATINTAIALGQKTAKGQDLFVYGWYKGENINFNFSDEPNAIADIRSSNSNLVYDFFFTKMRW